MTVVAFFAVVLAAGLGGYALLVRLGLPDGEAWGLGRVAGLVGTALLAWWAGCLGAMAWRSVGAAALITGSVAGVSTLWKRRRSWREIVVAECIFTLGWVTILVLRLDHPAIRGTEKPMDLGIFATLLRTKTFPPPDMWLAGFSLPYYYWGALVWTVPLWLSGVRLGVGYNLVVALLGGLTAVGVWVLASRLGRSKAGALGAVFLALLAGTPDGLRQLLAGRSLASLDYWASSRQVPHTITEFPLFTLWLGDLHPHLLSLPLALLAVALAAHTAVEGLRPGRLAAVAVACGATWAANPWAMPPTLAAVALMLIAGDGRWRWPFGTGLVRWAAAATVGIGGALAVAPFLLEFHPPFEGIGWVHAWTPLPDLLMFAGPLLVLAGCGALGYAVERPVADPNQRRMWIWLAVAWLVVMAALSGRPVMVLLAGLLAVLAWWGISGEDDPDRGAVWLAALGIFLFLIPEIVFVRDPYGAVLHRMNTVFKSYFQGWMFLAVAAPVLFRRAAGRRMGKVLLAAMLILPALPDLAGMMTAPLRAGRCGIAGLGWMAPGDRAAVGKLKHLPAGTVLVEAVGTAYSDFARLSSASGVPTLLGWANHELVWRGGSIGPELERRRRLVRQIYTCGSAAAIRRAARTVPFDVIALGAMERRRYPKLDENALLQAGRVILNEGGTMLIEVPRQTNTGASSK